MPSTFETYLTGKINIICLNLLIQRNIGKQKTEGKKLKWKNISASAGSRTRIDCLEGNHADRYTTDALEEIDDIFYLFLKNATTTCVRSVLQRRATTVEIENQLDIGEI